MDNCDDCVPESPEKRTQRPSDGHFPDQCSQDHGQQGGTPQISPADREHQHQPGLKGAEHEQQVRQPGKPGPQRPEKPIPHPQNSPQNQPGTEPLGGDHRYRHPKNRFQPPSRGSS